MPHVNTLQGILGHLEKLTFIKKQEQGRTQEADTDCRFKSQPAQHLKGGLASGQWMEG